MQIRHNDEFEPKKAEEYLRSGSRHGYQEYNGSPEKTIETAFCNTYLETRISKEVV